MECYRHKKVETNVRCGKCDKPICPKCMIPGPAGMRCPECASLKSSALYQIHPGRLVLATVVGLILGIVGAFLLWSIGFFTLFASPIYGGIVAEAILRTSGRKRGPILQFVGVGSIVIGYVLVILREVGNAFGSPAGMGVARASSSIWAVWHLIGAALAISACYGRMKYL